jgi:hypothetical protein
MGKPRCARVKCVDDFDGSSLTMADLPAPGPTRWVIRRKARVVAAVRDGLLSLEEACSRYMLTIDEIRAWQSPFDQHGVAGLRATRIQQYRQHQEPEKHVFSALELSRSSRQRARRVSISAK